MAKSVDCVKAYLCYRNGAWIATVNYEVSSTELPGAVIGKAGPEYVLDNAKSLKDVQDEIKASVESAEGVVIA